VRFFVLLLTAYFFLLGTLPQFDGSQLARLGQLWQHFGEHRVEIQPSGAELSFLDFLYEHYLAPEQHDHPDRSQHDQLPFQHLGAGPFITVTAAATLLPEPVELPESRPELGYRNVFYPVEFIDAISHPPSRA
jgi:hypothetical protein